MISLSLIAGNVEEYIERCLTSFLPIADEICLVRAIGNQKPDKTLEVAYAISEKAGIPFHSSEYENAPEHDWPHLDSFAAARNLSFSLATGDYIFWCDTDDVLKSGAELVREHAARNGYPVFMFPYDIFGRGVDFTRERMILRGSGEWIFPVHECFKFHNADVQAVEDQRVVVQHLPHTSKEGSNQRNLRIMEAIPEKDLTPGLLYHLHGELLGAQRHVEAIEMAKKALAHPDLGKPERYEIFLNLGRQCQDPQVARAYFHQAYAADPCRREALGLLTCSALDYQHYPEALAYARQMMATEAPQQTNWNDRKAAYDWLGIEIYTQALRMNGQRDQADGYRKSLLKQSSAPIISLIHATRGRPRQASLARKLWLDLAERPDAVEHIFVFDEDDEASLPLMRMHHLVVPAGGGCVNAWNSGALVSIGDILIQVSDDWCPPPRWDTLIKERFGDLGNPAVLAISDGHRTDDLLCMAIMTRTYFNFNWFMFHPRFTGVYSDNWFTQEAHLRDAVIDAKDLVFTHNHPLFAKGKPELDETYRHQNSPENYADGIKIYAQLNENFASDWSSIPGWFNYWQFYREIAKNLKDGDTVAEIGVWLGRSIIYLAQECQRLGKKVKFLAIDNFKGESNQIEHAATIATLAEQGSTLREQFEANIARCGVAERIQILDDDSADAARSVGDGRVAFCFIDAAHDYKSVKRDIAAWRPKLRSAGILAGHDAHVPEVKKAVLEFYPKAIIQEAIWIAK